MKRKMLLSMLLSCIFLLFCAKGMNVHAENNGDSVKKAEAGKEIVLKSGNIKEYVYEQLGKEPGESLYEEELTGYKGKLYMYSPVIVSGNDLDFVRHYFDMPVHWDITFPAGTYESAGAEAVMEGWSREQLEGLGDMEGEIQIRASEETIPVSVLPYFSRAESLSFDVRDVTGKIPENWQFPKSVKSVSLSSFSSAGYRNLMHCMEDSQIEQLSVYTDAQSKSPRIFWLDHAAKMRKLRSLYLDDNVIRVRDRDCLKEMKLSYLQCCIDGSTDLTFLEELPSLKRITFAVAEEMDLSSLVLQEDLELRIRFCRETVEFEDDIYDGDEPVIIPSFDKALDWKRDSGEKIRLEGSGYFLAIYQRCMDEGRKIECFTIRRKDETEEGFYEIWDVGTYLRVTEGEKVRILMPGRADSEYSVFGEYSSSYFQMQDISFDGIKDIILSAGHYGNALTSYEFGWIWDKEKEEYVACESYRQIPNPSVDRKQKLVRSTWRNSAASHGYAIYRYENGEFVLKSQMEESLLYGDEIPEDLEVPEGCEVWQWVETIYRDDGEIETRSFLEVNHPEEKLMGPKVFYEPGSYWGWSDED